MTSTQPTPDELRSDFMLAWHAANPTNRRVPDVSYENGWFVLRYDGHFSDRVRRSELLVMIGRLKERRAA